jgi:hypothetical protein
MSHHDPHGRVLINAIELERLRAELAELREANESFCKRQRWWNERMFTLETERDRLRDAIERAITHEPHHDMCDAVINVPGDEHPQEELCDCYKVRLRDALEGKP